MKRIIPVTAAVLLITGCTAIDDGTYSAETPVTAVTAETSSSAPQTQTEVSLITARTSQTAQPPQTTAFTTVFQTVTPAKETSAPTEPPAPTKPQVMPAAQGNGTNIFEVFDEIYLDDILPAGTELASENIRLDTSSAGNFKIVTSCLVNGKASSETIFFTVADTEPPVILNAGYDTEIRTGSDFEIGDHVGVGDLYDDIVNISFRGTVDTSAAGKYPITVSASDTSGNTTEWGITVTVSDEPSSWSGQSGYIPFSDIVSEHKNSGSVGIDVSKWQGDIDFEAVKSAGCEFVIMRIGKDISAPEEDERFAQNFALAKKAGLKTGVYFYTTANTEESILADADWIAEKLGGAELDFPVAFDWESFSCYQEYGMSIRKLNGFYDIFDERMKSHGYDTMLYSSKNFLMNFWTTDKPVWLAHYTDRTDYSGSYCMWQICSDGRINGIAGDVDVNIFYGF